jgi:hypothetical protein
MVLKRLRGVISTPSSDGSDERHGHAPQHGSTVTMKPTVPPGWTGTGDHNTTIIARPFSRPSLGGEPQPGLQLQLRPVQQRGGHGPLGGHPRAGVVPPDPRLQDQLLPVKCVINGKFQVSCKFPLCNRHNCNYQHDRKQSKSRQSIRYVQYDLKMALRQGKENKRKLDEMEVDNARKDDKVKQLKTSCVGWRKKYLKKETDVKTTTDQSALQVASIQASLTTTQASLLVGNRTNESITDELTSVAKKYDDLKALFESKRIEHARNVERSYRRGQESARGHNQKSQEERATQNKYVRQIKALLLQEEGANTDLRRKIARLKDLFYGSQRPKTPENL